MREMTIEEIKLCSIEVLRFFDKVCVGNGLRYFLCGGTLLGAIRHKGFIPWDDDIDVMMPRDDYERLFEVWPTNLRYSVLNHKNTNFFPYAYGKAVDNNTIKIEPIRDSCKKIGVDIDIFPLDNIPDDEIATASFFDQINKYQNLIYRQITPYGKNGGCLRTIRKNAHVFLLRILETFGLSSINNIVSDFSSFAQSYNDIITESWGVTTISHYGAREKNLKKEYDKVVTVTFEGQEYPAHSGYVQYLSKLYGSDFMEIPPVEKRVSHHVYKAFWKTTD